MCSEICATVLVDNTVFSFAGKTCDGANVSFLSGWNNVFNSCCFSLLIQYAIWRGISSKLAVKSIPLYFCTVQLYQSPDCHIQVIFLNTY